MSGLRDLPLRADLVGRSPYGAPQVDVAVRLNTNENPYPPPAELVSELAAEVATVAAGLNRYPDREALALRAALAGYLGHGLTAAQVWAANGSNEILQQLLLAFGGPGRTALGFAPSYSMHPLIAAATGTAWVDVARRSDFTIDAQHAAAAVEFHRPDVVFLTAPNNPTGTPLDAGVLRAVLSVAPGMVVVDEAYAEFATSGASAVGLVADGGGPALVITRTMSKAFTLAGARVGYLAADPAVVDALHLVRLPYHLSSVTQVVARVALRHAPALLATVAEVRGSRDALAAELVSRGVRVAPSDANFLLFSVDDSARMWQGLVDRGVLVRDVGLPGWLRVSIGTPAECTAFLAAYDAAVEQGSQR